MIACAAAILIRFIKNRGIIKKRAQAQFFILFFKRCLLAGWPRFCSMNYSAWLDVNHWGKQARVLANAVWIS